VSQVVSIKVAVGVTEKALNRFLEQWASVGRFTPAEIGYNLVADTGEKAIVTIEAGEIIFQGQFGDKGFSVIESFAESLGAELLYEGEPLESEEEVSKWIKMGPFGKSLSILGGIVLLPVAIMLLPILLMFLVFRLVFTLFVAERRVT